jgi:poly(A) polymerase
MKISPDWLAAPPLQRLMRAIGAGGFGCYVVGGALRNTLMGLPVADIDLASSATPENVTNMAEKAGFRVVPTGIDHGTVTVIADGAAYEVTTFRRDVATDGRHATVAFTSDMAQDAARRDFTINALYCDADGAVFDPVGGLLDISDRRVWFVGNPDHRIAEDYLRILRFFRFTAHYGDPDLGFDPDTLAACAAQADGIDQLSKERIGQEMRKLLSARDPAPALAAMSATGVLMRVLAGADPKFIAPIVHIEQGAARGWIARLALLGGQDPTANLRLSRAESVQLAAVMADLGETLTAAALGWRHGVQRGGDILHARAALMGQELPADWQAHLHRGAEATCPIAAADYMPRLMGPELGRALQAATNAWLRSDLRASRDDLLQG